ncbi:MOSC N-terminal beta barrel domain-containing protein [Nocardioides sp. 616]|uniref:MOSC domain-containing protein n=1 Tax=Nocardioides sp. 616 TaxID=2268090 RepID=UPI0013B43A70|nr:MOSC N-terminal beta barrel domain-containing protein [Nocardioides sp. 616]
MRLTDLFVHPVKSTAPRPLPSAEVLRRGLADDRSWALVDGRGVMVSARELPALVGVVTDTPVTDPGATAALHLRAPGQPTLSVDVPRGGRLTDFTMFSEHLQGVPAGAAADAWFRSLSGRDDLSLLWCDDPTRRRLANDRATPHDHTGYADAAPVSLVSRASLALLNEWIVQGAEQRQEEPEPVSVQRFRPNVVVDGDEPFAEDGWEAVQIGEVRFRVAGQISRCVITTVDPQALTRGKEPLRTLARHRRRGKGLVFAVELIPEGPGTIRVGDRVSPVTRPAAPGR